MVKNPSIIPCAQGFTIRFVRRSWAALTWIQDLSGRKMKSELVGRPMVIFASYQEAEAELRQTVIPYMLKEKDIDPEEILGW